MKKRIVNAYIYVILVSLLFQNITVSAQTESVKARNISPSEEDAIKVIVRGDDMGLSHSVNLACVKSYREGIVRSVEIMVPCPWFMEAVQFLRENPGIDVGVHLTLISEWEDYKWRPLTNATSLVDGNGYFVRSNRIYRDKKASLAEVERELRAQIELTLRYVKNVSHLSSHMQSVYNSPELKALAFRLSKEYRLPLDLSKYKKYFDSTGVFNMWAKPLGKKKDMLITWLKGLKPGLYLLYCHPGLDTEEMRGIQSGTEDADKRMAAHRQAATDLLTDGEIAQLVKKRNIQIISYDDLIDAYGYDE